MSHPGSSARSGTRRRGLLARFAGFLRSLLGRKAKKKKGNPNIYPLY